MANPADAYDILARLRIKGFRMGIDDFGTGYSSIVHYGRPKEGQAALVWLAKAR